MTRPAQVTIFRSAFRQNLRRARQLAARSKVWAVVKADAYGHGLQLLQPAFDEADGLALVEFDKALQLRASGWGRRILMLEGAFDYADTQAAASAGLDLVVHEARQIDWIEKLGGSASLRVHLKLNTGMNRLGFPPSEFRDAWQRLRCLTQVSSTTLITHFANADVAGGASQAIDLFDRVTTGMEGERSLCNSAALFLCESAHHNWVRPGIMLYGASPLSNRSADSLGLRPVMRFESRLISVQRIGPGDAVGYGSTFVAQRPMVIGTVACGYADGYPRHAPTGTPIAVAGVRTQTLGRVSMDMLAVDLGPVPDARLGSPVELWGAQVAVDEVAASAGTIGYELTCAIAPRVSRIVRDDDGSN